MQKKIISIILSVSLVFLCVVPCFAIENTTDAAIKSLNSFNDTKATTPSTTVEPEDSSATRYYVNSNGNVSSSSVSINTWGNIVNDLTYSIAYSIGEVVKRLTTINNNVVNYLFSNASTGYYLWDWTSSGGVYQGAPTSSQSVISQLRAMGSSITKMLSYCTEYAYQTYQTLLNSSFDSQGIIDALNQSDFVGIPYSGNLSQTIWQSNQDGTWSTFNQTVSPARRFQNLLIFLTAIQRNIALSNSGLVNGKGNDIVYNSDLTTSSSSTNSVTKTLQTYGSNISMHLARLAFVLASDEEIEARQAASDNQDSVVDNFIKPTGSGSASASDFADVASVGSSMKDALDSNVSAGNAFTSLDSNSDAWNWFSQSTLYSLDSSSSQNRKSAISDTPLLDSYFCDLMETLRLK